MIPLKIVILGLILALVLALVGIVLLAFQGHPVPDVLQNIAVGALTALAGVLVPTRTTS